MDIKNPNQLNQFFSNLSFLHLDSSLENCSENFTACKSGSQLSFANRVYIPKEFTINDLSSLYNFFDDLAFTLWIDTLNKVGNGKVQSLGFKSHITYPLMSCVIDKMPSNLINPCISIKRIDSNDEILTIWVLLVSAAYNNISISEFRKFIAYLLSTVNSHCIQFYIGYYNTHPCATSMLIVRNGCVDVHWVGVLPKYRNKGLGSAITYEILHASVMGKPIYQKMGFVEIGAASVYEIKKS